MSFRCLVSAPALVVVLALVALAGLTGCDTGGATEPGRSDLRVNFIGMNPHFGQKLELRVWHVESAVEVGYVQLNPIATANFLVTVPDILVAGERYYVDFYADLNRNGSYNAPPTDHAWRRQVFAVAGDTTINFTHDTIWVDIDFPRHP